MNHFFWPWHIPAMISLIFGGCERVPAVKNTLAGTCLGMPDKNHYSFKNPASNILPTLTNSSH